MDDVSKEQAAIQEIDAILKTSIEDINAALVALARLKGFADQLKVIVGSVTDKTNRITDASQGTSAR